MSCLKKILIIRFSSIGDIVLTSPVVRCIKQQLNAEVHYITKESFAPILRNNPYVDKVITIRKNVSEVKDVLAAGQYDDVIDLHHNLRSAQVKGIVKAPSASFPKLNFRKWLLVNAHINLMPDVHIVDRYFETVRALGVKNDGKGLEYFIAKEHAVHIEELPEQFRNGYVAMTAGAKFGTKQMPLRMMSNIIQRMNKPVVLLGGKEDVQRGGALAEEFPQLVYNTCGKLDLDQSASLLKNAELVITHDTGMMHIASAFKKKIYSVWGNTVPSLGMYPYLPGEGSKIIEVKGLDCRPCSKIGYAKCPKGHFNCMNRIDVNEFLH